MNWILFAAIVFIFCLLFYKYGTTRPAFAGKFFMPSLFLVKLLLGILSYYIHHTFYGGGDIAIFYHAAEQLRFIFIHQYDIFWDVFFIRNLENPEVFAWTNRIAYWDMGNKWLLPNDVRVIIKSLFAFNLVGNGNYFTTMAILSAISLSALNGYYRFFRWIAPQSKQLALFSAYLIPSVLFWSSAVLKESFALSAIGFSLYYYFKLQEKVKTKYIIGLLFAVTALVFVKTYLLISLVPPFTFLLIIRLKPSFSKILAFFVVFIGFGSAFILVDNISSKLNFFGIIKKRQADFINISKDNAASYFEVKTIETKSDFILYSPKAFVNTWLQPQVFYKPNTWVYWLQISENTVIYFLILFGFYVVFRLNPSQYKPFVSLILFSALACIFLGVLIGTIVPVQGAISRYKAPIMPFFISILFSLLFAYKPLLLKKVV